MHIMCALAANQYQHGMTVLSKHTLIQSASFVMKYMGVKLWKLEYWQGQTLMETLMQGKPYVVIKERMHVLTMSTHKRGKFKIVPHTFG